jgi:protein ImuB
LRKLGAFAAVAERDVAGRFGRDAILAHRLARKLSQRPPLRRALPPELEVLEEFETPLERIDEAAFIAKTLGNGSSPAWPATAWRVHGWRSWR